MLAQDQNLHPIPWASSKPTAKDATDRITKRTFYSKENYEGSIVFEWNYKYFEGYSDEEPGISVKIINN